MHSETESTTKLRKVNAELSTSLKRQEAMTSEYQDRINHAIAQRDSLQREKISTQTELESLKATQGKQNDLITHNQLKMKSLQAKVFKIQLYLSIS